MRADEFAKLENARRRMVDDNLPWMNDNGIRVVSAKVEDSTKYGPQCTVILQPEDNTEAGQPATVDIDKR